MVTKFNRSLKAFETAFLSVEFGEKNNLCCFHGLIFAVSSKSK